MEHVFISSEQTHSDVMTQRCPELVVAISCDPLLRGSRRERRTCLPRSIAENRFRTDLAAQVSPPAITRTHQCTSLSACVLTGTTISISELYGNNACNSKTAYMLNTAPSSIVLTEPSSQFNRPWHCCTFAVLSVRGLSTAIC